MIGGMAWMEPGICVDSRVAIAPSPADRPKSLAFHVSGSLQVEPRAL